MIDVSVITMNCAAAMTNNAIRAREFDSASTPDIDTHTGKGYTLLRP